MVRPVDGRLGRRLRRLRDVVVATLVHVGVEPVGLADPVLDAGLLGLVAQAGLLGPLLGARGVIVNQCGVPFMQADELRETSARRGRFFADISAYVAAVPTYVGGFMTLGWAAKDAALRALPVEEIRRRAAAAGILGGTRYWTPEIHVGAFHLPPYIAENLPG